jgi:hypothetical protein
METNTTDTPRTDAKYKDHEWDIMDHIPLEFCRQLEKEQAALRKEVARLRKENAELKQGKVTLFPESLKYPSVAPTEEGNVIFEWIRPNSRIELELNFEDRRLELYATNLSTNDFIEESFSNEQWNESLARISTLLLS